MKIRTTGRMTEVERFRHRQRVSDYVEAQKKSPLAAVLYAVFSGPFGCLYVNPKAAVVALFVAAAMGVIYWPLIGVVWVACVVVAPFQVKAYNRRLRRSAGFIVQ